MSKPTISIAMCTFNGAAWVGDQLRSIALQSRLPDELIVCDDCSTDATRQIIQRFADQAPFRVQMNNNTQRLGVSDNFSKAIQACNGSMIALCDQDDTWDADKLQRLESRLLDHPHLGMVFSNANLVDEQLRPLGVRLWDTLYLDDLQRGRLTNGQAVRVLTRTNVVTGATMMFRRELKEMILPIPACWVHDAWIALMASAVAQVGMLDDALVDYRQHPRQQIGARKTTIWEQIRMGLAMDRDYFRQEALRWQSAYQRLLENRHRLRYPRDLQRVAEKARFAMDRYRMRIDPQQRWSSIGRHWTDGRYAEMAWGWKSLLQDLVALP